MAAAAPSSRLELCAAVSCAHCGLDVPASRVAEHGESFCCAGCATVRAMLREHGLDAYYEIRAGVASAVAPATTTDRGYGEYDDPTFWARYVESAGENAAKIDLYLEGVHCSACLWLVERLPRLASEVTEARLDFGRSVVTVVFSRRALLSTIARSLDRLGYPPHPYRATSVREARRREDRKLLMRLAVAGACAGNIMLMSAALYSGERAGMAASHEQLFRWGSLLLALPAVLWSGRPFLRGGLAALRTRTAHMDLPIAIGIAVGLASGAINTVRGVGEVYFDSLATLVFALLVGRWLQQRQQRSASDAAELRHALTPQRARRIEGSRVVEIPVMAVARGDLLEVRPGEVFPADGRLRAPTSVDMSLLTGESRPISLAAGDHAHAGTLNLSRVVVLEALETGIDTRLGQLVAAMEEAARRKAPVVLLADRLSGIFVVVVMIIAAVVFAAWSVVSPSEAVARTVALLIVSCPCALGMATPLAIAAALGKAARAGILIKGGDVFERLIEPSTFYFDKTGTLTHGGSRVTSWEGDRSIAARVAGLERHANHPAGRALVAHAARVDSTVEAIDGALVRHVIGGGVEARLDDGLWRVGSPAFTGPTSDALAQRLDALGREGSTPVVVQRDGEVLAVIGLGDALRDDARASLEELRAMGHDVRILSGDHPATVERIAGALGLCASSAQGGVSPERKLEVVAADARAVMVGDGVNDAAALSRASVGIAVAGGAEASLAAADVFITESGVAPVVALVRGAHRVMRVIRRNLAISLAYNAVAITLAATGLIGPLGAALLMPLSSLTVVASSYRARTFEPRKAP